MTIQKISIPSILITLIIISLLLPIILIINSFASSTIVKQLDVPYINQCLQKDNKTLSPSIIGAIPNRIICRNMCLTSAAVMVAGYFGKVDFDKNNTDTLKKYLIEDPQIPERVRDGKSLIGGAFALTSYTDNNGNNNDNHADGLIKYANRKGIIASNINWIPSNYNAAKEFIYNKTKAAIDRNNILIISTKTHARVVTGYTNDGKITVNDSYRNTEIGKAGDFFNPNGKQAIYDLPTSGTSRPENPVEQFEYIIEFANSDPKFYNNQAPFVDGMPYKPVSRIGQSVKTYNTSSNKNWTSINLRKNIAEDIIAEIPWEEFGSIVSEPRYLQGYYREEIQFDNGLRGWIPSNFLVNYAQGGSSSQDNSSYVISTTYINVRDNYGRMSLVRNVLPPKEKGIIIDQYPQSVDGYNWVLVKWDNGNEGWSAKEFLKSY
jgi:Peptidase_C39 like family